MVWLDFGFLFETCQMAEQERSSRVEKERTTVTPSVQEVILALDFPDFIPSALSTFSCLFLFQGLATRRFS